MRATEPYAAQTPGVNQVKSIGGRRCRTFPPYCGNTVFSREQTSLRGWYRCLFTSGAVFVWDCKPAWWFCLGPQTRETAIADRTARTARISPVLKDGLTYRLGGFLAWRLRLFLLWRRRGLGRDRTNHVLNR